MSTLEDHLHPEVSNHDDDHHVQHEQESSFPMLYFEFDIISCLSSAEDDDTHHDDDAHERSLCPRNQQYRNPNLQKLQQSDQACCGISLNHEEGAEFSIHHSDQESSFLEQEEDDKGDSGSYSSSSYSLSSHDDEQRRRHPSLWQQARKNMIAAMKTKEYQRGPAARPEGLQQEEDKRKVRRMKACSGIDSVDLASCPRVNRHRRRRRARSSSSSSVLGPTAATSVARFLATNKRTSKIVPIPSENDSLVISMNRLSKQRQQEDSVMIPPSTSQEP